MKNIKGQKIIILGGTGSLGKALIDRFSKENELIIFSRDEAKQWTIKNKLSSLNKMQFCSRRY